MSSSGVSSCCVSLFEFNWKFLQLLEFDVFLVLSLLLEFDVGPRFFFFWHETEICIFLFITSLYNYISWCRRRASFVLSALCRSDVFVPCTFLRGFCVSRSAFQSATTITATVVELYGQASRTTDEKKKTGKTVRRFKLIIIPVILNRSARQEQWTGRNGARKDVMHNKLYNHDSNELLLFD